MIIGDLISRKAAELALLEKGQHSTRYGLGYIWELNFSEIREALSGVPDAEVPDTQTEDADLNFWESATNSTGNARCSKCKVMQCAVYDDEGWQAYCGHCGAKMSGIKRMAWKSF